MKYRIEACDAAGKSVSLSIEAGDPQEAQAAAQSQGLFVVSVSECKGGLNESHSTEVPRKVKKSGKRTAQFARELSVLVGTGTPIAESLRAIEKQASEPGWKSVIHAVRNSVEEGISLSASLAHHPGVFDPVFCSLIAAGESSGRLDDLLRRLSSMKRREMKARSLLIGAATYPAVLMAVAGAVMIAMIVFVIPRFAGLFETLNAPLPWTTEMLLLMSDAVKQWWWLCLIGAGVLGACLFWASRLASVQRHADMALCRIPLLGPVAQGFMVARTVRLLGVLLDAKVTMLESLTLVRRGIRRPLYAEWAQDAADMVTRGEALSGSFGDSLLFPPSIFEAISNAERTGQLSSVLIDLSDFLDDENEAVARTFTNLLEPFIMIILGVVVAFVALSMFLPLFDLTASVGGGG